MSICPKNKSSKAKKRQEKSPNWKMSAPKSGEMQQMWRTYDATQSLQKLVDLYNKREIVDCRKLIKKRL